MKATQSESNSVAERASIMGLFCRLFSKCSVPVFTLISKLLKLLERETGIEPATFSLGS
jgi:hypothetical protein